MVYNTALSYIQDTALAEEITQDVFMKIYQNAHRFEGKSSLKTWMYRITINSALNQIKKQKRHSFVQLNQDSKEKPDFEHPGVLLENKENARLLFKHIESLAHQQKTAFILSYLEELPRKEVAEIMETSLKAVESLLQRAKQQLRKKLESRFPNRRKS